MSPFARRLIAAVFLTSVATTLAPAKAYAVPPTAPTNEEANVVAALEKVMVDDVANANFGEARKKLKALFERCKKAKCSDNAMGQLHMGLAVTLAQMNKTEDARAAFRDAFAADSTVRPPESASDAAKTLYADERKVWSRKNPLGDDPVKGGWSQRAAFDVAREAATAYADSRFEECTERANRSIGIEDHQRTRLILARCEAKSRHLVNALRNAVAAKESADKKADATTGKEAESEIQDIMTKLPRVSFELPPEAKESVVTVDEKPVPNEKLKKGIVVDPGPHMVRAEATLRATRMSYEERVEVAEGENFLVKVKLKPAALTQGQLECMVSASSQAEVLKCLPDDSKPLVVKAATDMSAYSDSMAVRVLSPGIRASVAAPEAGWSAGAGYVLDMVSAASPDIVAQASPRFHDTRHAINANGAFKPGRVGGSLFGNFSTESDYVSRTIGGGISGDFLDKQVTTTLQFAHSSDTIGRQGTSYDVFSQSLNTEDIKLSGSFILDAKSVLVVGSNLIFESGNQSKPYRYVPMFQPGVSVPVGASPEEVNRTRLVAKPLEQLPESRQRYSVGGRYIRKMTPTTTLRLEERLYGDSWTVFASTTDARYMVDLSSRFRVWPHAHVHVQNGAIFYQRIYGATLRPDGSALLPSFRTTDRELSPMLGLTGGGGARFALTEPGAGIQFALVASADVLYNHYFNSLYVTDRLGAWATLGVEADLE